LLGFVPKLRKPVTFILLFASLVISFQFSAYLIGLLGKFQSIWFTEILHIKVNLIAGLIFPLVAAIMFLYLLLDLRKSVSHMFFVFFSLLVMTMIVYSIRTETAEMVIFDPSAMLFLAAVLLFLGILAFCWRRPITVAPDGRLLRRTIFFSSGIMWLSVLISELLILLRWHYESVLVERISYMVLGGAGFNDVLVFYGLVNTFSAILFFVILSFVSIFWRRLLPRNVSIAIYHDTKYPTSWIDYHFSSRIADLHQHLVAKIVDAEKLKSFMEESIRQKTSHLRLVVFSQDIVPMTIIEDYSSTNTFRES